jgi:hypothetical protein
MPRMWLGDDCVLATRTKVDAYWSGTDTVVVAEGTLPDPGSSAFLQHNPLDTPTPEFFLWRCPAPGYWAPDPTPFVKSGSFAVPEAATVVVHHAEGKDEVTVKGPDQLPPRDRRSPGMGDEAVGYSDSLSFDEAFADAVAHLGGVGNPDPDDGLSVAVTDIGAEFGGPLGARRLVVKVQRRQG